MNRVSLMRQRNLARLQSRNYAYKQFLQWFQRNEPALYRVAQKRLQLKEGARVQTVSGLAGFSWGGLFSSVVDTVKTAVPAALQYKQQKKIMDMQIKRAEQGLPPANIDDYMPAVKIEPKINENTEQAVTRVAKESIASGAKQLLLPLSLGFGALLLVMTSRRPQRR